jgi:hypothetical protein
MSGRSCWVQKTMPLRFIHLSDIHFGQERGELVYIHEDVRDQVLDDAQIVRDYSTIWRLHLEE